MKKILLYIICVVTCLWARAGNIISLPSVSGSPGEEVTISISLDNDDPISALQLQIPVTDGFTVVSGSEAVGTRAASHSARVGINNGTLVVMLWSSSMATISAGSGEVLSFRILLGNEPCSVGLVVNKATLTDADGNALEASATSGSVTISAAKAQLATRDIDFGHIPIRDTYHQSLGVTNVGNAPLIITGIEPSAPEFSSSTAFPYTIEAGNTGSVDITYAPVERGAISETVRLLSNNIAGTNTINITADPFAVNELHVENASGISDSTVTIPLRVNNMDALNGFQFEFDLPEQLQYVDGSFTLSSRKGDHQLVVTHNNGKLRAIAYSMSSSTFSGNDGVIATFDVKLNGRYGCNLGASKAVLTANYKGQDIDVLSDKYEGYIDIQSPQLYADDHLDLGATPVTEDAQGEVNVYNGGGAPLRIDRVVFDSDGFSVAESFPMVIDPWQSVTLHVTYNGQEQAPFEALMQLYSNDPDHRLHNITVTGSRFAPNYLHFTAEDVQNGSDLLLHVDLSNYDAINGLQFDITYPQQWFTPTDDYIWGERANGFTMSYRSIGNGVIRCFVYSIGNNEIAAGEGRVVTMKFATTEGVPEGQYSLSFDNLKAGTADLVDKYAGGDKNCTFNVSNFIYTSSLSLDHSEETLHMGESLTLNASYEPSDATDPGLTWEVSDPSVVELQGDGSQVIIVPLSLGTATVTVRTSDGSELYASCEVTVAPTLVSGLTLDKESATIEMHESLDLTVTYVPENATAPGLVWESSDPSIVEVQGDGINAVVTPVSLGTATVTVRTSDGSELSASCEVTVAPTLVSGLTLDKENATIEMHESLDLTVTYVPENATDPGLVWESSDESIVHVEAQEGGLTAIVTPVSLGTATVTVRTTDGSELSASCEVTVAPTLVSGLTLDKENATIEMHETLDLTVTYVPENATDPGLVWESSDESIVHVEPQEGGLTATVTPVALGTATITVRTSDGSELSASCEVTVAPTLVSGLALDKESATIEMHESLDLTVTYVPENATDPGLVWESSDESIVHVEAQEGGLTAVVTPVALGTATVTVRTSDGSELSASCEVTVAPTLVESLTLDVDSVTLFVNDELQINAFVEPDNATDPYVTWESSDNEIVEIQAVEENVVTIVARSQGTATITAYTNDGSELTASCTIVVKKQTIFGDVNCDGDVTSADITALYNYLLNGDETFIETSDVNGDGYVTSSDITVVYNILLGN